MMNSRCRTLTLLVLLSFAASSRAQTLPLGMQLGQTRSQIEQTLRSKDLLDRVSKELSGPNFIWLPVRFGEVGVGLSLSFRGGTLQSLSLSTSSIDYTTSDAESKIQRANAASNEIASFLQGNKFSRVGAGRIDAPVSDRDECYLAGDTFAHVVLTEVGAVYSHTGRAAELKRQYGAYVSGFGLNYISLRDSTETRRYLSTPVGQPRKTEPYASAECIAAMRRALK